MILFLLGIALTLNVIFGLIIYFFLIADYSFTNKKKNQELDVIEKIDTSFWG